MRAILTYHSIDPSGSPISVDADAFASHVKFLVSGRVRVVPLDELLGLPDSTDAVALTFDDGFANFADAAWPLLREHAMPALLFVVSGHAGRTNAWGGRDAPGIPTLPLLDWDALARLAAEGVTLGAHTRTHPDLRGVDERALDEEMDGSATSIAERTGTRPVAFAYPYGMVNAAVTRAAARHFRYACTTELCALRPGDEAHRLPRLDAYYLRRRGTIERWGSPAFRGSLRLRALARRARAVMTGGAA